METKQKWVTGSLQTSRLKNFLFKFRILVHLWDVSKHWAALQRAEYGAESRASSKHCAGSVERPGIDELLLDRAGKSRYHPNAAALFKTGHLVAETIRPGTFLLCVPLELKTMSKWQIRGQRPQLAVPGGKATKSVFSSLANFSNARYRLRCCLI